MKKAGRIDRLIKLNIEIINKLFITSVLLSHQKEGQQ